MNTANKKQEVADNFLRFMYGSVKGVRIRVYKFAFLPILPFTDHGDTVEVRALLVLIVGI